MKSLFLSLLLLSLAAPGSGEVRVVTSLPDLADLVRQIGRERVSVEAIVRGDQNPHYIELKPSYMMKLRSAHIFFTIGMELELWAQQLVDGSRNDRLNVVDLSRGIVKLEIPTRVDASEGDVHRFGNPHYWLDPRNIRTVVQTMVTALSAASPADAEYFRGNAETYLRTLDGKIKEWEALARPFAGRQIVTFHRSWSYFTTWLGIGVADQVEPKPGVPPSPSHTAELIDLVRRAGITVIVVEPFYDAGAAEQIARSTGAQLLRLPTSVGGVPEATDYPALIDYNVRTLIRALARTKG
jgi:zinc/manganese transport system substrate-binding protein